MTWYYVQDGERRGPVDDDALEALIQQGVLGPDSLVWRAGWVDWRKAETAEGVFIPPPVPLRDSGSTQVRRALPTVSSSVSSAKSAPPSAADTDRLPVVESQEWWNGVVLGLRVGRQPKDSEELENLISLLEQKRSATESQDWRDGAALGLRVARQPKESGELENLVAKLERLRATLDGRETADIPPRMTDQLGNVPRAEMPPKMPETLGTAWLSFWAYFRLPVAGLIFAVAVFQPEVPPVGQLICLALAVFSIALAFGLHQRRRWAWVAIWFALGLEVILAPLGKVLENDKDDPQGVLFVFICLAAIVLVVWVLPNAIYFKKRRHLFH